MTPGLNEACPICLGRKKIRAIKPHMAHVFEYIEEPCECQVDPRERIEKALAQRKEAGCTGFGHCHGCLKWCDWCGDVGDMCDCEVCDTHGRPRPEEPRRVVTRTWVFCGSSGMVFAETGISMITATVTLLESEMLPEALHYKIRMTGKSGSWTVDCVRGTEIWPVCDLPDLFWANKIEVVDCKLSIEVKIVGLSSEL